MQDRPALYMRLVDLVYGGHSKGISFHGWYNAL